jgi:hypothetical protein
MIRTKTIRTNCRSSDLEVGATVALSAFPKISIPRKEEIQVWQLSIEDDLSVKKCNVIDRR